MTNLQVLLLILVTALVTMSLRFLPFFIFGRGQKTPAYITYLGRVLPSAIMAMLVVYCLKGVSFSAISGWAAEAIAVLCVVLLHVWKKNSLLSILGGTVIYMILVQLPFFC